MTTRTREAIRAALAPDVLTRMDHEALVEILMREGATDRGVHARPKLYAHDRAIRAALAEYASAAAQDAEDKVLEERRRENDYNRRLPWGRP